MPIWVEIIVKLTPAFVALVVGLVAGGISYLQYNVNRDKLRLDLFNKRLEAYEKLQEFYSSVLAEGTVKNEALPILAQARFKSRFLFGPEIESSFETLWKKAVHIRTLGTRMYGPGSLPVGPERTRVCEQESELVRDILDEMKEAPNRYARYMRFT
jgi:hypothetical protein